MHPSTQHRFNNPSRGSVAVRVSYTSQEPYDQPLFCVKCNETASVATRVFSYSHIPLYAYFCHALNLLLGLLIIAISSGQHRIDQPFCNRCWRRYRIASWLAGLGVLVVIASIVGGLAMMLTLGSGYAFFPLPAFAVTFFASLLIVKRVTMPRILSSSKHEVVVDAGTYGQISFSKTTLARFHSS